MEYAKVINRTNKNLVLNSADGDSVQLQVGQHEQLIDMKFVDYQIPDINNLLVLEPDIYGLNPKPVEVKPVEVKAEEKPVVVEQKPVLKLKDTGE
jgi:hypothetical protein